MGSQVGVLVDPQSRTNEVYRSGINNPEVLGKGCINKLPFARSKNRSLFFKGKSEIIMLKKIVIAASTAVTLITLAWGQAAQSASFEVLASGLNSPRKLTFAPDGTLYFTEAGTGGSGPCISLRGQDNCYGATSTVNRLQNGVTVPVVTGLPSIALANGSDAAGASDIAFDENGNALVLLGWGGGDQRDSAVEFGQMGTIIRLESLNPGSSWTVISDLFAFERANNPDGGAIDSNPFSLTVREDRVFIADPGANATLSAGTDGSNLAVQAVFPDRLVQDPFAPPGNLIPMQAVPTASALGPDGAFYVSQLTGFPFPQGGANIYRLDSNNNPVIYASNFTNIVDLAFDERDNLYVLEYAANSILSGDPAGALIRISPDGKRQTILGDGDGLISPTGLAIGKDGYIYLSNNSDTAGQGEIIRVALSVPESSGTLGLLALGLLVPIAYLNPKKRKAKS